MTPPEQAAPSELDKADATAFERWWSASKYCQVAFGQNKQVAMDGWNAALIYAQQILIEHDAALAAQAPQTANAPAPFEPKCECGSCIPKWHHTDQRYYCATCGDPCSGFGDRAQAPQAKVCDEPFATLYNEGFEAGHTAGRLASQKDDGLPTPPLLCDCADGSPDIEYGEAVVGGLCNTCGEEFRIPAEPFDEEHAKQQAPQAEPTSCMDALEAAMLECGISPESQKEFNEAFFIGFRAGVAQTEKKLRAPQAEPTPLTDDEIIEIRDHHLPSQGEQFNCLAFAREVIYCAGLGLPQDKAEPTQWQQIFGHIEAAPPAAQKAESHHPADPKALFIPGSMAHVEQLQARITELETAAQKAEPVAYMYAQRGSRPMFLRADERHPRDTAIAYDWTETPLYAGPIAPPAAPQAERMKLLENVYAAAVDYLSWGESQVADAVEAWFKLLIVCEAIEEYDSAPSAPSGEEGT